MTDRPALFRGEMVRAILAGRKTQTRRLKSNWNVGDRLWVRETWRAGAGYDGVLPKLISIPPATIEYLATPLPPWKHGKTHQSIHMPRRASRLTLTVTALRVEKLQDISENDAVAEGVEWESADPPFYYVPGLPFVSLTAVGIEEPGGRHAARSYGKLWNHINGDGAWEANPEVKAYTFTVLAGNIDALPG